MNIFASEQKLSNRIMAESLEWLGTPYLHQASLKGIGCDCLGLIRGVWRQIYGDEPETAPGYSSDWGEADGTEPLLEVANKYFQTTESPSSGDLIVFRWRPHLPAKHVGILLSDHSFIHAHERTGVIQSRLAGHWQKSVAGYFNFPIPTTIKKS